MGDLLTGSYGIIIKIVLVVVLFGSLYGGHKYKVNQSVQEAVQIVKIQQVEEIFRQKEVIFDKAQKEKDKLQQSFDKAQKEKDAKIFTLNSSVNTLLNSLQQRPSRDSSNSGLGASSSAAESSRGAYPAELFREDAEAFILFGKDAEEVRLGLVQCYSDYESVKKSLESYSK